MDLFYGPSSKNSIQNNKTSVVWLSLTTLLACLAEPLVSFFMPLIFIPSEDTHTHIQKKHTESHDMIYGNMNHMPIISNYLLTVTTNHLKMDVSLITH